MKSKSRRFHTCHGWLSSGRSGAGQAAQARVTASQATAVSSSGTGPHYARGPDFEQHQRQQQLHRHQQRQHSAGKRQQGLAA